MTINYRDDESSVHAPPVYTHTHKHTHIQCTGQIIWSSIMSNGLTGWNRSAPANHLECILLCVCVCMHLFDADWWRAVTNRKEGCQYALPPLPCSLSTLWSARALVSVCTCVCVSVRCVLDVCRCPCFGRKWLWEAQQYSRQSISSNITPLESTWWCCYWLKCVAAPVFQRGRHFLAPTRFLSGTCWMTADDTDLLQERLGRGWVELWFSGSECEVIVRVCLLDYSVYPSSHFCNACLTKVIKWANITGAVGSSSSPTVSYPPVFSTPFPLPHLLFFYLPSCVTVTLMRWRVARANDRHEHGWNVRPNVKSTWSSAWPMLMNYEYSPPE